MIRAYKIFVSLFIFTQMFFIFKVYENKRLASLIHKFDSQESVYPIEVFNHLLFSTTKLNHLYNFFTTPTGSSNYTYITTCLNLMKLERNEDIKIFPISKNGSIQHLVNPINYSRINQLHYVSTLDTLLYKTIAQSEAFYFLKKYKSYPLLKIEVMVHNCTIKQTGHLFVKKEKIDTIYSQYFSK